ncbi:MAG TPA: hypothetical protein PKY08_01160 [Candidatus Magasanikbacteria bacterium]|nr:hypothetical protein [Candidatus Magasanikbacteria bacterium]
MVYTTEKDLGLIRVLRLSGILQDFDLTKCCDPQQLIVVDCADGSRKLELLLHHYNLAKTAEGNIDVDECVFHDPSLNGGALLLHPDSPLVTEELRQDKVLLDSIEGGVKFKHMEANGHRPLVVIYAHTPCAAATSLGMSVIEQMTWLVKAKLRLKILHPNWRVLCALHVFKAKSPTDKKKYASYIFSSKAFLSWLEKNPQP